MTATTAPRRSRRLLVPLATLIAATGIVAASGANFTTSTASVGLAASGTLTQLNSNTVAFSKDKMVPGDVVTGSVTITNTGTVPGAFTLTEANAALDTGEQAFSPASDVTLTIKKGAEVVSATKTLGTAAAVPLGTFAPGEARTYDYTVAFNALAGNSQQGKTARTTYTFDSVAVAGTYSGTPSTGTQVSPNP